MLRDRMGIMGYSNLLLCFTTFQQSTIHHKDNMVLPRKAVDKVNSETSIHKPQQNNKIKKWKSKEKV